MDGIEDPERGELPDDLSRIEPHGGQGHVESPAHLAVGLGLGGAPVETTAGEQGAHEDDGSQSEPAERLSFRRSPPRVYCGTIMSEPITVEKFAVGQSVRRLEDPRLIQGFGRYSDDVNLPHQAYAVVIRSPHAHAAIRSIEIHLCYETRLAY